MSCHVYVVASDDIKTLQLKIKTKASIGGSAGNKYPIPPITALTSIQQYDNCLYSLWLCDSYFIRYLVFVFFSIHLIYEKKTSRLAEYFK